MDLLFDFRKGRVQILRLAQDDGEGQPRGLARIIHERLQPSRGSFPPDTSSDLLCDAPGITVVGLPRPDEKSLAGARYISATRNIGATAHSSLNEMHVLRLGVRELSGLGLRRGL